MTRNFQLPGRSAVYGTRAMIATSHPEASLVGIEILRRGGTAVDAAIAACALLGVIEPAMTGIGGDCFAIVAPSGQAPRTLNGSGRAPAGATLDGALERGLSSIADNSPYAVTVPGAVDAWCELHSAYGRLDLAALLEPAARKAEEGYAIAPRVAFDWKRNEGRLRCHPATAAALLPSGAAPSVGDVHHQPALAQTLRAIGRRGREGFYAGEVADDIVATLNELGGVHQLDDFAEQRPTDPAMMPVTIEEFLSKKSVAFVRSMKQAIAPESPPSVDPWETDTICLSVVDQDGLAVSFINSLFNAFGSTILAPQSGVLLHCRGTSFSLDPKHPNRLAPHKRPMHTIIPGMIMRDGRARMPFGVMGGQYQAAGHAHLLLRLFQQGMDLQSAIDAPRVFGYNGTLQVEAGVSDDIVAHLVDAGHCVERLETPLGGAQAIWINHERGVLVGGSDARKDGCALGF